MLKQKRPHGRFSTTPGASEQDVRVILVYLKPLTLRPYPGHNLELLAWILQSKLLCSHQCRLSSEWFRDAPPYLYIIDLHQAGFVAARPRLLPAMESLRRSFWLAAMPSNYVLVTALQACRRSRHVNVIGISSEDLPP